MSDQVHQLVRALGSAPEPARRHYAYTITSLYPDKGYRAALHRGDDKPLKHFPPVASRELAEQQCRKHFSNACRGMEALGLPWPSVSVN